jgi:hypothetical protein
VEFHVYFVKELYPDWSARAEDKENRRLIKAVFFGILKP